MDHYDAPSSVSEEFDTWFETVENGRQGEVSSSGGPLAIAPLNLTSASPPQAASGQGTSLKDQVLVLYQARELAKALQRMEGPTLVAEAQRIADKCSEGKLLFIKPSNTRCDIYLYADKYFTLTKLCTCRYLRRTCFIYRYSVFGPETLPHLHCSVTRKARGSSGARVRRF